MKKFLVLLCLIIFQTASFGADVLEGCYKIYPKDADSLFMTAI